MIFDRRVILFYIGYWVYFIGRGCGVDNMASVLLHEGDEGARDTQHPHHGIHSRGSPHHPFPSATIFNSIFHGSERYINLWVFIYLTVLMLLRTCCSTSCFTSTNIFVNLAAPRDVGKANGIAFTLAGLVKALVPTAGANILAWSLNSGYPFPFDYHLVFWLLGLTALLGVGVSLTIDAQLERG